MKSGSPGGDTMIQYNESFTYFGNYNYRLIKALDSTVMNFKQTSRTIWNE